MKFLTSPYMMAVATIIYMVVGTVRDAYFPASESTVVSASLPLPPPTDVTPPPESTVSSFTVFPDYNLPMGDQPPAGLTEEAHSDYRPLAPPRVYATTTRAETVDSAAYTAQERLISPSRTMPPAQDLMVEEGL